MLPSSAGKSRANRSGRTGESIVAAMRDAARIRGVADVRKVPTPTVGANGARRFSKRSTVDGVGFMLDGTGRVVAEEVKTCASKTRLSLREVETHQRAFLNAVERARGVAVLTVVLGPERAVYVAPWSAVRDLVSVGAKELASYRVTASDYLARFVEKAPALARVPW